MNVSPTSNAVYLAERRLEGIRAGCRKTVPIEKVMRCYGAWAIEFDTAAQRELNTLDPTISRRILKFLLGRVAKLDDPRKIGERLQGQLHHLRKYRVRLLDPLCSFKQELLVVLVLEIGHRREIYER